MFIVADICDSNLLHLILFVQSHDLPLPDLFDFWGPPESDVHQPFPNLEPT